MWTRILLVSICTSACFAQRGEVGAAIGYGLYRNASVYSPAGKAQAGIRDRFAAGFVISDDMYDHLSGEVRYTYQDGDPFLSAGGVRQNVQGQSHTAHFDLLFHFRKRDTRMRPYVAAGIGAKLYRVSGPPLMTQPLSAIATLSTEDDVRPVVVGGGGVKFLVHRHIIVRVDFRAYITPFPKKLFVPAPFGTGRGTLHQYTPMAGISYAF